MTRARVAAAWLCTWLAMGVPMAAQSGGTAAGLGHAAQLRVFLDDGTSLVSYGEPARVGDRVVFSMPTSASDEDPQLHLVSIPAARVDWPRTDRYAESVRADWYLATHADDQYAMLTAEIGQALNDVALATDAAGRLAIVERARRALAEWPARHFNYKWAEIQEMLAILDEAIADLRAAAGLARFDFTLAATTTPAAPRAPLLPEPTPKEAIEQTLAAARLTESPAERVSLMSVALATIDHEAERLPSDWRTAQRMTIRASLAADLDTDRQYRSLATRMAGLADRRARAADVRGLERLLTEIQRQDETLGAKRPDAVHAIVSTVEDRLDAARRLSLARDRWALRVPDLRQFQAVIDGPLSRLGRLAAPLEDLRAMVGSTPAVLQLVERTASDVLAVVSLLTPPDELRAAHALLVSAAQLATTAARIRREAALSGDMSRAWDASSAAAGALMLTARVASELQSALSLPQLSQ